MTMSQQHFKSTLKLIKSKSTLTNIISQTGKLAIPIPYGHKLYDADEILYFKAESNYTSIITKSGENLIISKTLKTIEALLPDFLFVRCHRTYLVNNKHVVELQFKNGGFLILTNNDKIPISRHRKKVLSEWSLIHR
jgi:two-component system LytT family response regulator